MASISRSGLLLNPSRRGLIPVLKALSGVSSSKAFHCTARRSLATEVQPPLVPAQRTTSTAMRSIPISPPGNLNFQPVREVLATLYKFPSLEPVCFESYPASFLHLPLRRDILQRAVIYEGDSHRWGRAKTKWRSEVHGTGKKMRPQKGMGRARLGDKKSPMLRGGGVAHGPKPRDFSTELPRKIYNLAWRTALSWRYRRGTLVVINDRLEPMTDDKGYIRELLRRNRWDNGATLYITVKERTHLFNYLRENGKFGRALELKDVDVKDLLEPGRVVIERAALNWILERRGHAATSRFTAAKASTMTLSDPRTNRIKHLPAS